MRRTRLLFATLFFAASMMALCTEAAADAYPGKTIRIVLGYPAGSGIDNVARLIGHHLAATSGQAVIVENKPGALGNIAAQTVAVAPADGYTLLFTPNSSLAINVHLFKKLPFDPVKDFTPVAPLATLGFVVLVNPAVLPVTTLQELTTLIRKEPGKYSYGTGNATGQVAGALYASTAKLDVLNVPYKGVPPALTDLMGGSIHFLMADASLAIPQIRAGSVRALAVTSKSRIAVLKDVPTMSEAGLPGYDLTGWFGIFLPAKAPPEVTRYLTTHLRMAMSDPAVVASLRAIGVEPMVGDGAELAQMVKTDTEKWGRIIKQAGIKAE
jgi:tripartite-type tricarboxylate transporter receptor subunit TctC